MEEFLLKAQRYNDLDAAPPTNGNFAGWILMSWQAVDVMKPLVDELRRTAPNARIAATVERLDVFVESFDHLMQDSASLNEVLTDGAEHFRQLAEDTPPQEIFLKYMVKNCGGPPTPSTSSEACIATADLLAGVEENADSFQRPSKSGFGEWVLVAHQAYTAVHPLLSSARRAAPNARIADAVELLDDHLHDFDNMLRDSTSLNDVRRNGAELFGRLGSDVPPISTLKGYVNEQCG